MSNAYLIKSSISHTRDFYVKFSATVDAVPFDGPAALEAEYRLQLRRFLTHLDHNTNYQRKQKRWEDVTTPVPYKLGRDDVPLIFTPSSILGFTSGLEMLERTGLMVRRAHDRHRQKCREFAVDQGTRLGWYKTSRKMRQVLKEHNLEDYKRLERGYDVTRSPRGQRPCSLQQMIDAAALKGVTKPKHDLSELNGQTKVKARYAKVLSMVEENEVNLDVIIQYMQEQQLLAETGKKKHRKANVSRYYGAAASIESILRNGVRVVSESPLVVAYLPTCRVAAVGGRLFEIGGGFQTLPGHVKWRAFHKGDNYDIKASQLNILESVFDSYGITSSFFFDFPTVEHIAEALKIEKKEAKVVLYGTIFSAGTISASPNNSVYDYLCGRYKPSKATKILNLWRSTAGDLIAGLKTLSQKVWAEGKSSTCLTWTNAVGIKFRHKDAKSGRAQRQLLAHIIQGHETEFVLRTVELGNKCYAFEHDGIVGEVSKAPRYKGLIYELKHTASEQPELVPDINRNEIVLPVQNEAPLEAPILEHVEEVAPTHATTGLYHHTPTGGLDGDGWGPGGGGEDHLPLVCSSEPPHNDQGSFYVRYTPSGWRVLSRLLGSATLPISSLPPVSTAPPRRKRGPETLARPRSRRRNEPQRLAA